MFNFETPIKFIPDLLIGNWLQGPAPLRAVPVIIKRSRASRQEKQRTDRPINIEITQNALLSKMCIRPNFPSYNSGTIPRTTWKCPVVPPC